MVVNLIGLISELTVSMNSLIDFSIFEKVGVSIKEMWGNPLFLTLITLVIIGLMCYLLVMFFKFIFGRGSFGQILTVFIGILFLVTSMISIHTNPEQYWNTMNRAMNLSVNLGESAIMNYNDKMRNLTGGDPNAIYWIPYFNAWGRFMTGTSLSDDRNQIKNDNKPETKNLTIPNINGNNINLWTALLADSFVGDRIDNNAYRVIDHFLAPRIEINEGNKEGKITAKENENKPFSYQGLIDIDLSTLLSVLLLFTIVMTKFLIFIDLFLILYMLFIELALRTVSGKDPVKLFIRIVFDLVSLTFAGIISSFVVASDMVFQGWFKIAFVLTEIFILLKVFNLWRESEYAPIVVTKFLEGLSKAKGLFIQAKTKVGRSKLNRSLKDKIKEFSNRAKSYLSAKNIEKGIKITTKGITDKINKFKAGKIESEDKPKDTEIPDTEVLKENKYDEIINKSDDLNQKEETEETEKEEESKDNVDTEESESNSEDNENKE